MRYALRHWSGLVVFLDDGRVEMDSNVVERRDQANTDDPFIMPLLQGLWKHWDLIFWATTDTGGVCVPSP